LARTARSHLPIRGRVLARGTGSRIVADLRNIEMAGSSLSGQVTLGENWALGGEVKGPIGDTGRLVTAIEGFLGRNPGSLLFTSIAGPADVDARFSGTVGSPVIASRVTTPALALGSATGLGVDAGVVYTPAAVAIDRADVVWKDARAHADGRIGVGRDGQIA